MLYNEQSSLTLIYVIRMVYLLYDGALLIAFVLMVSNKNGILVQADPLHYKPWQKFFFLGRGIIYQGVV